MPEPQFSKRVSLYESGYLSESAALIERYPGGPSRLAALVKPLSETVLDMASPDDGWTIRATVHHIADGDQFWTTAIKMALGPEEHLFELPWYWRADQTLWADRWCYTERDVTPALDLLIANRRIVVDILQNFPYSLDRSVHVRWPNGTLESGTIRVVLQMQNDHLLGHASDIEAILAQRSAGP